MRSPYDPLASLHEWAAAPAAPSYRAAPPRYDPLADLIVAALEWEAVKGRSKCVEAVGCGLDG